MKFGLINNHTENRELIHEEKYRKKRPQNFSMKEILIDEISQLRNFV